MFCLEGATLRSKGFYVCGDRCGFLRFGCGEMTIGAAMLSRRPHAVRTRGYAAHGEPVFFHEILVSKL